MSSSSWATSWYATARSFGTSAAASPLSGAPTLAQALVDPAGIAIARAHQTLCDALQYVLDHKRRPG